MLLHSTALLPSAAVCRLKFTHTANCYATDEPARVLVVTLTLALAQVT